MAAATDNRKYIGDGSNLSRDQAALAFNGPIAASAVLFTGCLAGQLYSDTAIHPAILNYVADGTMRCIGFVTLAADNTGGVLNARPTRVVAETGMLVDKNTGGANAITTADLYKPAYGVDNQTCSKLSSDGPCIGMITAVDQQTGQPVILVDATLALQFALSAGAGMPSGRRVRLVTTANVNLATTGLTAIDGVTPVAGDTILVAAQTVTSQNGVYIASAGAWQLAQFWQAGLVLSDMTFEVSEGTVWAHSTWKLMTQGAIVPGTTGLAFYPRQHKFTSGAMVAGTLALTALWIFSATGQIMATVNTVGGTVGPPHVNSRVAGAGVGTATLNSTGADTSTVDIAILNW